MFIRQAGGDAAAGGAVEESDLDEEGFVDLFEGVLEHARPEELEPIEIPPSGFGIHFPKLDADLYVPGLLEGFLGSREWTASRMGASGGKSRSRAKCSASKKNGRLGGRPRKKKVA